jgi:valyl-tRNA synthetase
MHFLVTTSLLRTTLSFIKFFINFFFFSNLILGDEIVVATTRVETMLGDTAVAVHPEDPR